MQNETVYPRPNLKRWSAADEQLLRDGASKGLYWLTETLGRSEPAIYTRASALGVSIAKTLEYDPHAEPLAIKRWILENRILPRLVENGECSEWHGANKGGYGQIRFFIGTEMRMFYTHRLALEVSNAEEFPSNIEALHKCDNPRCCNVRHLYAGTHRDNARDMMERGRGRNQFKKSAA